MGLIDAPPLRGHDAGRGRKGAIEPRAGFVIQAGHVDRRPFAEGAQAGPGVAGGECEPSFVDRGRVLTEEKEGFDEIEAEEWVGAEVVDRAAKESAGLVQRSAFSGIGLIHRIWCSNQRNPILATVVYISSTLQKALITYT